jgi:hypothetical protein
LHLLVFSQIHKANVSLILEFFYFVFLSALDLLMELFACALVPVSVIFKQVNIHAKFVENHSSLYQSLLLDQSDALHPLVAPTSRTVAEFRAEFNNNRGSHKDCKAQEYGYLGGEFYNESLESHCSAHG